jgi:hypothetical protein
MHSTFPTQLSFLAEAFAPGPYFFMGAVILVLAGVGAYRWFQERNRKLSVKRGMFNTMTRAEQRRWLKENRIKKFK